MTKKPPAPKRLHGVWYKLVIGSTKEASDGPGLGRYHYWQRKDRLSDGTVVTAEVYPDMTTGQGEPEGKHLWGVAFNEAAELTRFDPKTNSSITVRPALPAKKLGGKAASLAAAKTVAEVAMMTGREKPLAQPRQEPMYADEPPDDA